MNWIALAAGLGSFGGISVLGYLFYRAAYNSGRDTVLREMAEKKAKVKDAQLKAIVNRPDSDKRLRSGNF